MHAGDDHNRAVALDEVQQPSSDEEAMDEDEVEVEDAVVLPEPIRAEDVLRCTRCAWEIIDGFCYHCGLEHIEYPVCCSFHSRQPMLNAYSIGR